MERTGWEAALHEEYYHIDTYPVKELLRNYAMRFAQKGIDPAAGWKSVGREREVKTPGRKVNAWVARWVN